MMRRYWTMVALAACACSHTARTAESLLPETVNRAWQRKSLSPITPPQATVQRAFEATYEGAGKLVVDLYETKASAVAFEMTQRWKPAPDTVFFDKGVYFVVVKWEQADRQALTAFVRGLQDHLGREKP